MEYIIAEESKASGFPLNEIGRVSQPVEFRPRVGQIIRIGTRINQDLRITRCIPPDNPPDVQVTYVIQYMSDVDKIAGGSLKGFEQFYISN